MELDGLAAQRLRFVARLTGNGNARQAGNVGAPGRIALLVKDGADHGFSSPDFRPAAWKMDLKVPSGTSRPSFPATVMTIALPGCLN